MSLPVAQTPRRRRFPSIRSSIPRLVRALSSSPRRRFEEERVGSEATRLRLCSIFHSDVDAAKASLENVPGSAHESVCVPDLGDFLGYQGAAHQVAATPKHKGPATPASSAAPSASGPRTGTQPQPPSSTLQPSSTAVSLPSRQYHNDGKCLFSLSVPVPGLAVHDGNVLPRTGTARRESKRNSRISTLSTPSDVERSTRPRAPGPTLVSSRGYKSVAVSARETALDNIASTERRIEHLLSGVDCR